MKISIITRFNGITILGRITKMQITGILQRDAQNKVLRIQTITEEMLKQFRDLSTFDGVFTQDCKNELITTLEKSGMGSFFYVTEDTLGLTPTKVMVARNILEYMSQGMDYCSAQAKALEECSEMGRKEIEGGINGTFCTEQIINIRNANKEAYGPGKVNLAAAKAVGIWTPEGLK